MESRNIPLRKIIVTGLMTALVFLATSFIKIPSPNGYIHFGDGFVFLSALILGPFYGAFAAGVGSMLADLLSPYAQWALPTFIVKSLMAFMMGMIVRHKGKKQAFVKNTGFGSGIVLGMLSAGVWMILGYYIAEVILYGNPFSPVASIPMNLIQLAAGMVITIVIAPPLLKAYSFLIKDGPPSV